MGPLPRREEPVHRRRQRLRDGRRGEPDLDHPGRGALHRRPDEAAAGEFVRLTLMSSPVFGGGYRRGKATLAISLIPDLKPADTTTGAGPLLYPPPYDGG